MTKNVPSKNTKENTNKITTPEDRLREMIAQQVGEVASGSDRKVIVERMYSLMISENFSGPLPLPRHLAEYEATYTGLAERIVQMAESNQAHQQSCDNKIIDADILDRRVGLYGGLFVFAALVFLSVFFAVNENLVASGLFLTPAVLGVLKYLFNRNGN